MIRLSPTLKGLSAPTRRGLVYGFACFMMALWGCSGSADPTAPATSVSAGGGASTNSGSTTAGSQCATGLTQCPEGCVDLTSSPTSCGSCGTPCAVGQTCQASACQCSSGLSACVSGCAETNSDAANCGGCDNACGAGLVCSLGTCSDTCADGLEQCGQNCVDTNTSTLNCGICDNACPSGLACEAGACVCPVAGQTLCNGECADTMTSTAHCGDCGKQCGAGQTCEAGACMGGTTTTTSTTDGGGGTGGGGTSGTPEGLTGVVVGIDDAGTLGCVPLCQEAEHPDDPDTTDDWAYEGYSCVLPNSPTGTRNQACTTGEELPEIDRSGLPGVVVDAGDGLTCIPYCSEGAEPSSPDPENPASYDWGWEYQASCIIIDSDTGQCNQRCTTGQDLPDASLVSRPGVVIDDACVALCECDTASAEYPDWGWEYQKECVVPGSDSAADKLDCTTNEDQDFTPPPLTGSTVADGFYTQSGHLYDAYGNEFVMRGVNNPHIWFDTGNQYLAYQALDRIASYNTNTIRVVWETSGTATLLARVLARIVEFDMVPMVELHDATGSQSNSDLQAMAAYFAQSDVAAVLEDFRAYALINIANEWSGTDFAGAYANAISTIRNAGLNHTLVIDANSFGQNADSVLTNASTLLDADPQSNLLFSVHMYNSYQSSSNVTSVLDQAINNAVPLVIGEFGPQLQGVNVAWDAILSGCQQRGIGYIAWSWSGNDSSTQNLNIVNDFGGSLTPQWGQQVMVSHAASIQNTAQKASIFQ